MRVERSKNEKMKKMLSGLNFGGSSVQMFNPGSGGGPAASLAAAAAT